MSREMIEILILAAIAAFVVARLYSVLGRRTGSERPTAPPPQAQRQAPAPAQFDTPIKPAPQAGPGPSPQPTFALPGIGDIAKADPGFDPSGFISGARAAYEMIVGAFAQGDRETLRGLLTPRVFNAYDAAITQRQASNGAGPELVRLKSAEIVDAALAGETARVAVRYEAELAEGVAGVRETQERWTFERDVRSRNPTWLLAGVAQA